MDYEHVQMRLKGRRDVKASGQKAQCDEGWVISLAFYFCAFGLLPIFPALISLVPLNTESVFCASEQNIQGQKKGGEAKEGNGKCEQMGVRCNRGKIDEKKRETQEMKKVL